MASQFLLPRLFTSRPLIYGIGAGLTSTLLMHRPLSQRNLLYCDNSVTGSSSPRDWSFSQYQNEAKTPVLKKGGGLNPGAVRQITRGSIAGVICGLAVSVFSKSLALLVGLLIVGVQFAESKGITLIPYNRLQNYVKGVDLRSAVQDNVALKLSFGATFALAGFAQLQ